MSWMTGLRYRLREMIHRSRADEEAAEELQDHLQREIPIDTASPRDGDTGSGR